MAELEKQLQHAQHPIHLQTMQYGKYTDDIRQCCLALLSSNVGVNHIGGVIRDGLKLVNVSAEPLPSSSLLKQMIVEGRAVSLVQIGEAARHNNNTLHYDGTTKFGRKYGSFHLHTEDEQPPPPRPASSGWLLPVELWQSRSRRDPEGITPERLSPSFWATS